MDWLKGKTVNLSPTGGKVPDGVKIKQQTCTYCKGIMVITQVNDTLLWVCDDCTLMLDLE